MSKENSPETPENENVHGHDHAHGHDDHGGHSHNVDVKVDRLSATRVKLTLTFDAAQVKEHEKGTLQNYMRVSKLPGFRPGKAPVKMVQDKYKDDIKKDLLSHLVDAGLHEGLVKANLIPLTRPRIALKDTVLSADKPFVFEAEFEIQPEIELKNYKGVPIKKESEEVSDDEVTKTLDNIRDRMAVLEPVEAKKVEKGEFAVLQIGFEFLENPDKNEVPRPYTVEIGTEKIFPELDAAVLEMTVGESRKVPGKFPEDYGDKALAGKSVIFSCTLQEVKKKTLPALDDALAGQLKEGGTLDSLREEIRQGIRSSKQDEAKRSRRSQIVEHLTKIHTFEVPQSMVEQQAQSLMQWMENERRQQGMPAGSLKEEELKQVRVRAEQMVKSSLLLKEIAVKEKIVVDEAKLNQKIEAIATQLQRNADETRKFLSGKGMLDQLRDEVMTDQIFDFLIENAKIGA